MTERLTWEEIKRRYPDEWMHLHELDAVTTEANIRSGVVVGHDNSRQRVDEWRRMNVPARRHEDLRGMYFTGEVRRRFLF